MKESQRPWRSSGDASYQAKAQAVAVFSQDKTSGYSRFDGSLQLHHETRALVREVQSYLVTHGAVAMTTQTRCPRCKHKTELIKGIGCAIIRCTWCAWKREFLTEIFK